ncbi:glycosyl transferase [Thelonectria olida]|uniref:Glycosyl transferase n=1 Tax=Thelonectria olida TaxID=1576542 RepID=A0A9P9ANR0_9HYPO|nr:glycosyl transferase [Thelonectria olida]
MSYRTASSNSPLYMFKNPMKSSKQLPFEQPTLSDEDFEVFARLMRDQQALDAPGIWSKSVGRLLYVALLSSILYFGFVGWPLWDGAAYWFWNFYHDEVAQDQIWGLIAFLVAGTIRNFLPQFFCTFDRTEPASDPEKPRDASECCVIIPCYKSAETLRLTLPACLAIFGPEQIFVVANGNSPTPLDHTADVCAEFGVRHFWVPVGSKITAEFVGVALAGQYKYCMLIDDDVLLPANLPLPTHVFGGSDSSNKVACVGYTIKSVGTNSSRGTLIQQVQDIEYKVAGLAKVFQSYYGSVIFPHGAVALWRRGVLEKIFHGHPGYHISEDWYLGHTARAAGYRMVMSSQVFVETETPPRLFPAPFAKKGDSRGGYGEMSIYKQRFFRWNFFFLFRIWSNAAYLIFSWRLGWRELFTKLWVFGECYDSLIMLFAPIVLPVSLAANWRFTLIVSGGLLVANSLLVCWFNVVHLGLLRRARATDERVAWIAFPAYMFVKFVMVFVNVASVYWSIYEYAFFFTRQHLRVTESVPAWQVIRESIHRTIPE